MLTLSFDRARTKQDKFRPCSTEKKCSTVAQARYVSTVLKVCIARQSTKCLSNGLKIGFDDVQEAFQPCLRFVSNNVLKVSFRCARGIFWLCSRYVSTVLEACFDCAQDMF